MRAGMLEHMPPIHVRAILLQRIALLDADSTCTEKRWKARRQRMRQVDHGSEAPLRASRRGAGRDETCGRGGALEQVAARHRAPNRLRASGNAHDDLPLLQPDAGSLAQDVHAIAEA